MTKMNWSKIRYVFNHLRSIEKRLDVKHRKLRLQNFFRITHSRTGYCTDTESTKLEDVKKHNFSWSVLFFGTDEFSIETLKALNENRMKDVNPLVGNLEVVSLLGQTIVRQYAVENGLTVHDWPVKVKEGKYDIGVVVSFGRLIPSSTINSFPYGILNVHPSLLPRWRGSTPIIHTVLHGDRETGVSIMKIRPKQFDVGPILFQKTFPVHSRITSDSLSTKLANKGAVMLVSCLKDFPSLSLNEVKQDSANVTYAPKITKGMAQIDWMNKSCDEIDNQYRAISSLIPLFTLWNARKIKLLDMVDPVLTKDLKIDKFEAIPVGSVIFYWKYRILLIKCKDGFVGFRKIVYKKHLTALEFYNGILSQTVNKYIVFDMNRESAMNSMRS